jgi:hypothetical protein
MHLGVGDSADNQIERPGMMLGLIFVLINGDEIIRSHL